MARCVLKEHSMSTLKSLVCVFGGAWASLCFGCADESGSYPESKSQVSAPIESDAFTDSVVLNAQEELAPLVGQVVVMSARSPEGSIRYLAARIESVTEIRVGASVEPWVEVKLQDYDEALAQESFDNLIRERAALLETSEESVRDSVRIRSFPPEEPGGTVRELGIGLYQGPRGSIMFGEADPLYELLRARITIGGTQK